MTTETLTNPVSKELSKTDRCDACGAQAYVLVEGTAGELLFCGHHYTKIMNDPKGQLAMSSFAFNTIDNRSEISDRGPGQ